MSVKLAIPGTDEFCRFVEPYFSAVEFTIDTKSKSNHIVYRIPSHPFNISVPTGYSRLKMGTFAGLLADMGLDLQEYRELAGTRQKLKEYCKQRKRVRRTGPQTQA